MRAEHVVGSVLAVVLAGGQAKTVISSSDLGVKIDAQGSTLTALQLSMTEIKANGAASDKITERLSGDLSAVVRELRELRDRSVRSDAKQEDYERRLRELEREGKK